MNRPTIRRSLALAVVTIAFAAPLGADAARDASLVASQVASASQAGPRGAKVNPQPVDGALPAYAKKADVSGSIRVVGDATVTRLLGAASDAFREKHAGVKADVRGESISAGIAALADGKADLAGLGRRLTAAEREQLTTKLGAAPIEIVVALEGIEVVVNAKNPVASLSLADLSGIFAATPQGRGAVATWGDVGVTDEKLAKKPLTVFGMPSDEKRGGIVDTDILHGSAFRSDLRKVASSDAVVGGVLSELAGVGYIDPYFRPSSLRAVPITKSGGNAIACSSSTIADGSYPLGRRLYVCVARKNGEALSAQVSEFLAFVLSKDGQTAISVSGGMPATASLASESRAALK